MDQGPQQRPGPVGVSRFLFVVPDFAGHINPSIPVGVELSRRGHETAWTGVPGLVNVLLPEGAAFIPACADEPGAFAGALHERFRGLRGPAALKFLWYDALFPMSRLMIDGVHAAVEEFQPDVLVVDQQALAGAIVARRRGLPWATLATTSAELCNPLADYPVVARAIRDARVALQLEAGVAPDTATEGDLLFSPHLVLVCSTNALVGTDRCFPNHYQFVGLATSGRVETASFPWSWLDGARPAVLVSLGSINAQEGGRFFAAAVEALRTLPVQGVIVAPPEMVPDPPDTILVRPWVPQLALLARLSAVVTHAGHNTVCESLAAGVPLVMAPVQNDQPIIADQVVRAGCGIRVSFARVSAPELRAAIHQALTDPDLRAAADTVRRSFAAAAGSLSAADHLEKLACNT